jgi:hypothetical protein
MFAKLKPMALAIASITAAGAVMSAHAAPGANAPSLPINPATQLLVLGAGASAQDAGVMGYMRSICADDSLVVYTDGVSASYPYVGTYALYFCNNNTNTSIGVALTGTQSTIAFSKNSAGSAQGVAPTNSHSNTGFLDTTTNFSTAAFSCFSTQISVPTVYQYAGGTSTSSTSGTATGTRLLGSALVYQNCNKGSTITTTNSSPYVTQAAADIGFADVEPRLLTTGPSQYNNLGIFPGNAVIFGVAVTKTMYTALQSAQGLPTDDLPTSMPSLSKQQLSAVFNGSITKPSQLNLTATDDNFVIVRRSTTSGTQAFAAAYFLSSQLNSTTPKCVTGADLFVGITQTTCTDPFPAGYKVYAGGSTELNKVCLNVLNSNSAGSRFGIGLVSTELPPATADGYRFIKINGAPPSLYAAFNGQYDYVAESTLNYRIAGSFPLGGNQKVLADNLIAKFGNPEIVQAIDTPLKLPVSDGGTTFNAGILTPFTSTTTLPPQSFPLTNAKILDNTIWPYTKSSSGSANNCLPPQLGSFNVENKAE